ncbi:hypothetical protein QZH41_015639 [Actinostola sp. cb2023]|nr:hypothetical protein QZH41_015639 [Actinostola sp. cb2023]
MGVQALQDYVESHCPKGCQLLEMKDFIKARKADGMEAVVVVDAFSCVRYLYGYNSDWVCGGQWSEMLRNVENFVRSFRQHNIQIVAFLAGEGESLRIQEWIKNQEQRRQTIHKVLNHVVRQANFPPKRLFFLPPAAKMCLRLAFRSCGVPVCCSFSDLHQELVSYSRDGRCCGLVGHDAAYLLLNPPAYLSAEQLIVNKKNITLKHFDLDIVFSEMGLKSSRLALFASLLGTPFISEEILSPFHWALIGSDKPAIKNQTNGQSVLPPNNVVIRKMVEFVNQISDISNYGWIVSQVFKDTNADLKAMEEKLRQSIQYYNSNRITSGNLLICKGKLDKISITDKQMKLVNAKLAEKEEDDHQYQKGKEEHQYKKRWQHWQQHQLNSQPVIASQTEETNGKDHDTQDINQLQENFKQLNVENNGICEQSAVTPTSPVATPNATEPLLTSPTYPGSPSMLFPTPPPSVENSPLPGKDQSPTTVNQPALNTPPIQGIIDSITPQVLEIVKQRHQSGQMTEYVYQVLTRAEITISTALEDEHSIDYQPTALLYRPIRQYIYGILFDKKACERKQGQHDPPPTVKEWCVYRGEKLDKPDLVDAVSMKWNIPELQELWFGKEPVDNLNRMKAFLTCLQSDTPNMTKTTMVPHRLIIMCCVLRYLLQQGKPGQPVLLSHEVDAFLAAALSPHISTEFNPANLSQLKLMHVEVRGVQIASIFMRGVQAASFANDACGCPVPWELVCPWNYFDGKLFMSKFIQVANDVTLSELCDGKNARLEKLHRMRWCINEGIAPELLGVRLPMAGFHGMGMPAGPSMPFFGIPTMSGVSIHGNFIPAGARIPPPIPLGDRPRTRGISSKRPVSGLGGTLEVAGVPVANWGGNRAGRDYSEHSRIVAGGAGSVEIPSRGRNRGGRGRRGGGTWPNTRNVTWAVEVDKDYDRRIGYKDPNTRSPNLHIIPDQGIPHMGYGNEGPMIHHGPGYPGNIPDSTMTDPSTHPTPPYTAPLVQQPTMNMHMAMTPPPTLHTDDKAPLGQVHILAKPSDKLAGQGRGRGIAATLNNVGGIVKPGQTSSIGRGYLLDKPQQSPAT